MIDNTIKIDTEVKQLKEKYLLDLEAQLKAMKQKIEREMLDNDIKMVEGELGKATYVESNRKKLNIESMCKGLKIKEDDIQQYTEETLVKYIRINNKDFKKSK